jgi:hypothetical protein
MPTVRQYELAEAKASGKTLQLIDTKTRKVLKTGDELTDFRGEKGKLASFDPRRVYVRWPDAEFDQGYFPGVFGCEVVIEGEV